jgi:hypothetical protein
MMTFDNRETADKNSVGPLSKAKNEKRVADMNLYSSPDKIGKMVANKVINLVRQQLVQ